MPVSELLAAVLNESGYETMLRTEGSQIRLDNLAELKQSIYAYETTCGEECTLEHYLAHVAMFTSADLDDPRDQVRLMTVHSAKGLEFPYVFLCAMNEGIFPSKKTRTMPGMEEERRLCFVAMTRAQKGLYLSEAEGRNLDGSPRYPSRFLLDIRDDLLTFTKTPREDLIRQAREYIGFSSRFLDDAAAAQGLRARHPRPPRRLRRRDRAGHRPGTEIAARPVRCHADAARDLAAREAGAGIKDRRAGSVASCPPCAVIGKIRRPTCPRGRWRRSCRPRRRRRSQDRPSRS
ncbi:MAG: 3'-5' exonuclease [Oscillospiraceae bacterium]